MRSGALSRPSQTARRRISVRFCYKALGFVTLLHCQNVQRPLFDACLVALWTLFMAVETEASDAWGRIGRSIALFPGV